jgi:ketosteroid isomerase-like protein
MSNQDVINKYYGYFGQANWKGLKDECFHKDIVWKMPGHHPMSGTMQGVDSVVAFLQNLYTAGIRVDNVHVGELDDGTIVEKHLGHGEANGEQFLFPTCTTYGFKDGKIFEVQVHTGDQHNVDRYFWARFPLKGIPERLLQA